MAQATKIQQSVIDGVTVQIIEVGDNSFTRISTANAVVSVTPPTEGQAPSIMIVANGVKLTFVGYKGYAEIGNTTVKVTVAENGEIELVRFCTDENVLVYSQKKGWLIA